MSLCVNTDFRSPKTFDVRPPRSKFKVDLTDDRPTGTRRSTIKDKTVHSYYLGEESQQHFVTYVLRVVFATVYTRESFPIDDDY